MLNFTSKEQWEKHVEGRVLAVLYHAGLSIESPWSEIETCLSRCAGPVVCIAAARRLLLEEKEK